MIVVQEHLKVSQPNHLEGAFMLVLYLENICEQTIKLIFDLNYQSYHILSLNLLLKEVLGPEQSSTFETDSVAINEKAWHEERQIIQDNTIICQKLGATISICHERLEDLNLLILDG